MYNVLSNLYADLRGYGRSEIRRRVRDNARAGREQLARDTRELFGQRVIRAMWRFPSYAEKVRQFSGARERQSSDPCGHPVWTRDDQVTLFDTLKRPPIPGSFAHATGGSTGMPVRFYMTRESYEWRTAVSERGYSWARAEEGRRSFYVWGSPVSPPGPVLRGKKDLHHWLQRRTYFDSFDFDDEQKARCCRAIDRCRPYAVVGYAGNLVELARFVEAVHGALKWRARSIVTAAEGLLPGQRELLEKNLGDEVFMSYGSREFMLIGMECGEHRGYHIASDNLFVEVADGQGASVPPGESGRILITDLRNDANPFVRYEIGDLGAMSVEPCPCGLPFPVLARVDGRIQEVILTPDGARLTALFIPHLMKEFPWVRGYQLVQETPAALRVNLITASELSDDMTAPIAGALRERVGKEMKLSFVRVDRLVRSGSGKTPIVVAQI